MSPGREVAEDVAANETRNRFATVDVAARDGVPDVWVLATDRWRQIRARVAQARPRSSRHIACALEAAPAVVAAALDAIDFLDSLSPTSPTQSSPAGGSKLQRQGLRKPQA